MRVMSIHFGILLTFAFILIQPPCQAQDAVEKKYPNPDEPWLETLKSTWNEVRNVSPLACIFIMLPVTLCFLFCGCVSCICIKCCKSNEERRPSSSGSSSSSRIVVKSPDGQLDPIPLTGLTGLVHHHHKTGFQPLRPVMGAHPTSPA